MNINKKKLIDETNFWDIFAKVADIYDITIKKNSDFNFIPNKSMFISKDLYDPYYFENPETHNDTDGPYFIIITFRNGEDKIDTIEATVSFAEIYPFEDYNKELYIESQETQFEMSYIVSENAWTSIELFFDKLQYENPELYNELLTNPDAVLNEE